MQALHPQEQVLKLRSKVMKTGEHNKMYIPLKSSSLVDLTMLGSIEFP